jgi:L-fuculose-phosphate aldolase
MRDSAVSEGRRAVAIAAARMRTAGLNRVSFAGNISARLGSDAMLITPSGMEKDSLDAKDISVMSLYGKVSDGPRPSSEWRLHAALYRKHGGILAVVHPHPIFSLTVTDVMGLDGLALGAYEEVQYYLGGDGTVGLVNGKSGTQELADKVAEAMRSGARVVIIKGHGTVAAGGSLGEALSRAEALEYFSEQSYRISCLKHIA